MTTDYHSICTIDTPTEDRVSCKCGAIAVDGGSWYLRRAGNPGDFIERSVQFNHIQDED